MTRNLADLSTGTLRRLTLFNFPLARLVGAILLASLGVFVFLRGVSPLESGSLQAPAANFEVRISPDNDTVLPGTTIVYTCSFLTSDTYSDKILTATLSPSVTFVAASTGGNVVSPSNQVITWSLSIRGRGFVTVTVDNTFPSGIDQIITVGTGDGATPYTSSLTLLAEPKYDLGLSVWPTEVQEGDLLTYTIILTNTGTQEGTGIVMTSTLPHENMTVISATGGGQEIAPGSGIVTWTVNSLLAGQRITRELYVSIAPTLTGCSNVLTNHIEVRDDGRNSNVQGVPISDDESVVHVIEGIPDLVAHKDRGDSGMNTIKPGDAPIYRLRVSNNSPYTVTEVSLIDVLSEFVTIANENDLIEEGWSIGDGRITYTLAELGACKPRTFYIQLAFTSTPPSNLSYITNTLVVTTTAGLDRNLTNNVAQHVDQVDITPDLVIQKSALDSWAIAGEQQIYTLTISNPSAKPVEDVMVKDFLPDSVAFEAASDEGIATWESGQQMILWPLFDLSANARKVLTLTTQVTNVTPIPTTFLNESRVYWTHEGLDYSRKAEHLTHIEGPDLRVDLSSTPTIADPGMHITYTLVVSNAGPGTASGVVATSTLVDYAPLVSTPSLGVSRKINLPKSR